MVDSSNSRVESCMQGEYLKYILENEMGLMGFIHFIVTTVTMWEWSNENS